MMKILASAPNNSK